jgi:hypothetical protein
VEDKSCTNVDEGLTPRGSEEAAAARARLAAAGALGRIQVPHSARRIRAGGHRAYHHVSTCGAAQSARRPYGDHHSGPVLTAASASSSS